MTREEMKYAVYTDFYRIQGKEFRLRDKIKVWLNYHIPAVFRVMYCYHHCIYYCDNNKLLYKFWSYYFKRVSEYYNVEIPDSVCIGNGFIFYHANGIIMQPNTIIGNNCAILQQVTIGNSWKIRT